MKELLLKLVVVGVLAGIAGLNMAALVGGLLTGVIDGLDRGQAVIQMSSRPGAFWLTGAVYLTVGTISAFAAYKILKKI